MVVDLINGQSRQAPVECQAFVGLTVGAVNGLFQINVDYGVVLLRHHPLDFIGFKDFLIFIAVRNSVRERTATAVAERPFSSKKYPSRTSPVRTNA